MTTKSTKKGKEIGEHLNNVNMDPWFYIYENVKNEPKEKLNQTEKEQNEASKA